MQTKRQQGTTVNNASIEKLKRCLQAELSAVETYELALKGVTHVGLHHTLQQILASHAQRSERLDERIVRLGAEAPKSSGAWGTFAKVVQHGADLLGERVAVAALEAGEDRGLVLYTEGVRACDTETRQLIETELLPEQQRTHEQCKTLRNFMETPS